MTNAYNLDDAKAKYDYLQKRRLSESTRVNPYRILRIAKIALTEFNLCTKINQLGPITIVELLPLFNEDMRFIANCLKNIESKNWIKVLHTSNGCKHFVKFNWKGTGV